MNKLPEQIVRELLDNDQFVDECKKKFIQEYDDCEHERCIIQDNKDTAIWLWRVHNSYNVHLGGKDLAWPSKEMCPTCRKTDLEVSIQKNDIQLSEERRLNAIASKATEDKKQKVEVAAVGGSKKSRRGGVVGVKRDAGEALLNCIMKVVEKSKKSRVQELLQNFMIDFYHHQYQIRLKMHSV